MDLEGAVEALYQNGRHLDRKSFALTHRDHPLFGLAIQRHSGKEVDVRDWYARRRLKQDFGLRVLASDVIAEAIEG